MTSPLVSSSVSFARFVFTGFSFESSEHLCCDIIKMLTDFVECSQKFFKRFIKQICFSAPTNTLKRISKYIEYEFEIMISSD